MKKIPDTASYFNVCQLTAHQYICGFCDAKVASDRGFYAEYYLNAATRRTCGYIYICPQCKMPSFNIPGEPEMFPGYALGRSIKFLPEDVDALYEEARTCYSNGCYTSAVFLARKLLMHIAVEKGAKENESFLFYVNYLDVNQYIPNGAKRWVDEIRKIGNDANHEIEIMDQTKTNRVMEFLQYLLIIVYELPNSLPADK